MKRIEPTILVTAGPTQASLDGIRFISNYSTGKLGFEICRQLTSAGFSVIGVIGTTPLPFESLGLKKIIRVETCREMHNAVIQLGRKYKPVYAIFSAAVLDFVPETRVRRKVSSSKSWSITLVPTPKIVREFAQIFPSTERIEFKLEMTRTAARKKALDVMRKYQPLAICFNGFRDIGTKIHRARILVRNGKELRNSTKRQIARTICRLIKESQVDQN